VAKLKTVRLKQSEIQFLLSRIRHSTKNDPLIDK